MPAQDATVTAVASDASGSVTLAAANRARKGLLVYNASTEILYLKFGATASSTSFTVKLSAGDYFEAPHYPIYVGLVTGRWANQNGFAYVTEMVA